MGRCTGDTPPDPAPREFEGVQGVVTVDMDCVMRGSSLGPAEDRLRAEDWAEVAPAEEAVGVSNWRRKMSSLVEWVDAIVVLALSHESKSKCSQCVPDDAVAGEKATESTRRPERLVAR